MEAGKDVPVIVRRRRRAARQARESTPDASKTHDDRGSQTNSCDEQSAEEQRVDTRRSRADEEVQSYRNKILQRRNKAFAAVSIRSQSSPRVENGEKEEHHSDIFSLLKRAKRSLSTPRKKDESSDSGKVSDSEIQKRAEKREQRTKRDADRQEQSAILNSNLGRFNEERRKFELEKLKFLQEKRELDRMRLRRFEKYREEVLEEQKKKLTNELRSREEASRPKVINKVPLSPPPRTVPPLSPATLRRKMAPLQRYAPSNPSGSSSGDEDNLSSAGSDNDRRISYIENVAARKAQKAEPEQAPEVIPEVEPKITEEVVEEPEVFVETTTEIVSETISEVIPQANMEEETVLTKRKVPKMNGEEIHKEEEEIVEKKDILNGHDTKKTDIDSDKEPEPKELTLGVVFQEWYDVWRQFVEEHAEDIKRIRVQIHECYFYFGVLVILCGVGGIVFRFTEGTFESQYKCGVKKVKRDFIDSLWLSSHNLKEDDWKQVARNRLRQFEEELQIAFEAGMKSYSGNTAWNFINGVVYSLTVVTTIGYGHISPSTTTGRALTILYAIIGIPIFLIVLADFGKLFTRGIKFMWAYVRRLYHTGSIRKVRKTSQVQEMVRGFNSVYDMIRKPSHPTAEEVPGVAATPGLSPNLTVPPPSCESPATPIPEEIAIDDEFNLPISLAIFILAAYMLFGASIYCTWEDWSFFEAFYFVFISISTIGFGDFVPQHPIYMMCSILYLIFGLALTSMCINVVQLKLSDSFRQASSKIGATIGFQMAEAASIQQSQQHSPVELASVHIATPNANGTATATATATVNGEPPALPPKKSPSTQSKV